MKSPPSTPDTARAFIQAYTTDGYAAYVAARKVAGLPNPDDAVGLVSSLSPLDVDNLQRLDYLAAPLLHVSSASLPFSSVSLEQMGTSCYNRSTSFGLLSALDISVLQPMESAVSISASEYSFGFVSTDDLVDLPISLAAAMPVSPSTDFFVLEQIGTGCEIFSTVFGLVGEVSALDISVLQQMDSAVSILDIHVLDLYRVSPLSYDIQLKLLIIVNWYVNIYLLGWHSFE